MTKGMLDGEWHPRRGRMSPLYLAVYYNQPNVVEYMMEQGVWPELIGARIKYTTAMHLAAALGHVEVIPVYLSVLLTLPLQNEHLIRINCLGDHLSYK